MSLADVNNYLLQHPPTEDMKVLGQAALMLFFVAFGALSSLCDGFPKTRGLVIFGRVVFLLLFIPLLVIVFYIVFEIWPQLRLWAMFV